MTISSTSGVIRETITHCKVVVISRGYAIWLPIIQLHCLSLCNTPLCNFSCRCPACLTVVWDDGGSYVTISSGASSSVRTEVHVMKARNGTRLLSPYLTLIPSESRRTKPHSDHLDLSNQTITTKSFVVLLFFTHRYFVKEKKTLNKAKLHELRHIAIMLEIVFSDQSGDKSHMNYTAFTLVGRKIQVVTVNSCVTSDICPTNSVVASDQPSLPASHTHTLIQAAPASWGHQLLFLY